ncbi:hypothetical protein TUM4249_36940 [Shewanella sp. KT0246]|nr:hypothetical protein TUM4249_36940 [Shewanella sp. KT0246]
MFSQTNEFNNEQLDRYHVSSGYKTINYVETDNQTDKAQFSNK